LKWKDENIIKAKVSDNLDWFSGWEPIWQPKIEFLNEIENVERFRYNYHTDKSGYVRYYGRYRGTFFEPYQLHRFPFDRHYLQIRLSTIYPLNKQIYVPYENYQNTMETNVLAAWNIPQNPLDVQILTESKDFAKCNLRCKIERQPQFYIWNVLLMLSLIVIMSYSSFVFPPTDLSSRLNVTLTLVLVAVAFKFVVADSLPKIAYQTYLDKYTLSAFINLFLVCLQNFIAYMISYYYNKLDYFPAFDQISFGILGGIWIISNTVIWIVVATNWNKARLDWDHVKSPF